MEQTSMKIDLHCHSKFSQRPVLWLMQKIGCPESFTEPMELYHLLRNQGMNLVTITDHNTIDGALEIADLPDTFISCEYTTYFPDDNCKVHVVAYDITEAQHSDLNQARRNIYDLASYLQKNRIKHVLAHPFFSPNDRLGPLHAEKLILLFKNWEWNGDITADMNLAMRQIIDQLTPGDVERLANKHNLIPAFPEPWKKNFTSGSDDHSSLNLGSAYTEVLNATDFDHFWDGVEEGQAKLRHNSVTPENLARNVYGIAYQFYKSKLGLERYVRKDLFLCFLERALRTRPEGSEPKLAWYHGLLSLGRRNMDEKSKTQGSILNLARAEAEKMIRDDPQLMSIVKAGTSQSGDMDKKWFEFVNQLSNKMLVQFGKRIMDRVAGGKWFDLFSSLGSAGVLYGLLAPYFVSFSLHTSQRKSSESLMRHFSKGQTTDESNANEYRVAHFTDTFHETNSVARHLRKELATALKLGMDYSVVTCQSGEQKLRRGVLAFQPVGKINIPEYSELPLLCPPFLQILQHCYEEQFTHIHAATPGPMGLASLAISRILKLPISGTFHSSIPQYANIHTEDGFVSDMLWKYMMWFYDQMDTIYVPSRRTREELVARGIKPEKIQLHARGVDTQFFKPHPHPELFRKRYGFSEDQTVFLFAGRLARGKNLGLLCQAFANMVKKGYPVHLVFAGEGPYRKQLEKDTKGLPVSFTGKLDDENMARLYNACEIMVYPSGTDTFGDSVLEAQASALPVIVSDTGGSHEHVVDGETGLIVKANSRQTLFHAMENLHKDHSLRRNMGAAARKHMENLDFTKAFETMWADYTKNITHRQDEDHILSMDRLAGAALQEMAL
ncbi:MAG: glycosyltransferase [Candidatus Sumerlaeia bacterium]